MKHLLTKAVRKATRWAWQKEIDICDGIAEVEEMHATPGHMEMVLSESPARSHYIAACFASIVAKAPNYVEMNFKPSAAHLRDEDIGKPGYDMVTVCVQKVTGKTPHQLRMEAERKAEEAHKEACFQVGRKKELETVLRAIFLDESDLSEEGFAKIEKALGGCAK
jgi:hypothetical protein